NVPADTCQIDEIDFASPRMVGGTTEPNARIGPIQGLLGNTVPPPVQIVDVKPHHEVLRKILIIETLKNELGPSISKSGVAVALPPLLEPQLGEQSPTRLVIFAAWYEWKQRIREQIFHGSAFNTVYGLGMPNGSRLSCGALKKDSFLDLRAPPASSAC